MEPAVIGLIAAVILTAAVGLGLLIEFRRTRLPETRAGRHLQEATKAAQEGEFEDAKAHLLEAVNLEPDLAAAYKGLADLSFRTNNVSDVIKYLKIYLEKNPQDMEVRFRLIPMLTTASRYREAIDLIDSLPSGMKQQPRIVNLRAVCLLDSGQPKAAISYLEKNGLSGAKDDPVHLTNKYVLALAHKESGNPQRAKKVFQEIREIDPGFQDIDQQIIQVERMLVAGERE